MKKTHILICILLQYFFVQSQTQYGITSYPRPSGYSLMKTKTTGGLGIDNLGNKWVGYDSIGLGKFSGTQLNPNWTIYDTSNSPIPSNRVTCLFASGNTVYAGTDKGLARYDSSGWVIYDTTSGLPNGYITAVCYKNGSLWAGTNKGAAKLSGHNWIKYNTQNSAILSDSVTAMEIDRNNDIWMGTKNGISYFHNNVFTNIDTSNSALRSNNITVLKKDIHDNLWIGTETTGAYRMEVGNINQLQNLYPVAGFNYIITTIGMNDDNIVIAGNTTTGSINSAICLLMIDQNDYSYRAYFYPSGYNLKRPISLCPDVNNIIWCAAFNSPYYGLFSFDENDTGVVIMDEMNYLSANNIKAIFRSSGPLFWNDEINTFEVPKGSGRNTLFCGNLWVGGKDYSGQIHLAAERFQQNGRDYFLGPVMDSAYYATEQRYWNKVWKLTRPAIDSHINHWPDAGYVVPQTIAGWPGNGDTAKGQAHDLAPYYDYNHNDIYDPQNGDYPMIKGDEAVFFIFNDDRKPHTESGGKKLKVEIHAMAYAFAIPGDSALWNTIFINYKIINRSSNTYDSAYLSLFVDPDVGNHLDDYISCDVQRGTFFGYNGDSLDEDQGGRPGYGLHPPAQGITILGGPFMDPDGIDNPAGIDFGINGLNFGDSIIDNERLGMCRFYYFNNPMSGIPYYSTDPETAPEYYNFFRGLWKDSSLIIYGGNGYPDSVSCGPAARFVYPWNSDSLHWGTNYITPTCFPDNWTEYEVGYPPSDRRGVSIMGPFTMRSGSVNEVDVAFIFARDFLHKRYFNSLDVLYQRIDSIRNYFLSGNYPGNSIISVNEIGPPLNQINIYPNPAKSRITVEYPDYLQSDKPMLELWSISGSLIKCLTLRSSKTIINISDLSSGMYILKVKDSSGMIVKKVVKE